MALGLETVTDCLVSVSFLACLLLVICDMTKVSLKTVTADEIAAAAPSMEPALEGPSRRIDEVVITAFSCCGHIRP